jgi:hypothetical protein
MAWVGGVYTQQTREVPQTNYSSYYSDDRAAITDVVGEYFRFNGVMHTKNKACPAFMPLNAVAGSKPPSPWPYSGTWTKYKQVNSVGWVGNLFFQGRTNPPGGTMPSPTFLSSDWTERVYQVGSQLDGRMTTGQNLLVDVMQIAQVAGMFKNPFNMRKLPKQLRSMTMKQLSKSVASGYLEYQFGWKNIYRDMLALANVWTEVRTHDAYLKASAGKFVSISDRGTEQATPPSISLTPIGAPDYCAFTPKLSLCKRTHSFSLDIQREEQALLWSKFDQVMSRLGARDVALALWDCVPYSFIVDWFTHINRFVGQRSIDWLSYDLRRVGYSYKTTWYGYFDIVSNATGWGGSQNLAYQTTPFIVQEQYERYPGFPAGTSSVGLFGNLNKTQIAEGLALIVQRI